MYTLYLATNDEGCERITTVDTIDEIFKTINDCYIVYGLHPSPYSRFWLKDNDTVVMDFGSWSQFFYIVGNTSWLTK